LYDIKVDLTNRSTDYNCTNRRGRTNAELNVDYTSLYNVYLYIVESLVYRVLSVAYG